MPVIRVFLFGVLAALVSSTARAQAPSKLECVSAHEQSQVTRRAGKLLEAKKHLLICAQSSCPEAAQEPCQRWLREVEASIPTVVIAAEGSDRKPVLDVRVFIDGELVAEKLEGRALAVDTGTHRFRFERGDDKPREVELTLLEGEKNRRVAVSFAGPIAPTPSGPQDRPKEAAPIPVGTYVLGGIGVASLAAFTVFALRGVDQESSLRDRECAPDCPKDDVDRVRRDYLIADVALGVGVVSIGIATWLFVDSRSARPVDAGVSIGPHRATAAVRGRF